MLPHLLIVASCLCQVGCNKNLKNINPFKFMSKIRGETYVVKSGDTVSSISSRAGISYTQLARLNDIEPPYTIYPGKKLRVKAPPRVVNLNAKKSVIKEKTHKQKNTVVKKIKPKPRPAVVATSSTSWRWPVYGPILEKFTSGKLKKNGLDIGGKTGDRVNAAKKGVVVYSGNGLRGYGNLIIIKHENNFLSAYAHNSENIVKEGEAVSLGQQIAKMGNSGSDKTMLHFEIRHHGQPIDPLKVLPAK